MILGTTNLSGFDNLRGKLYPDGWSPIGGQSYGAYSDNHSPSGSSSGSCVLLLDSASLPLVLGQRYG